MTDYLVVLAVISLVAVDILVAGVSRDTVVFGCQGGVLLLPRPEIFQTIDCSERLSDFVYEIVCPVVYSGDVGCYIYGFIVA